MQELTVTTNALSNVYTIEYQKMVTMSKRNPNKFVDRFNLDPADTTAEE